LSGWRVWKPLEWIPPVHRKVTEGRSPKRACRAGGMKMEEFGPLASWGGNAIKGGKKG